MKSENLAYYAGGENIRDSYDATGGTNCEKVYEIAGGGENNFNLRFCTQCNNSIDLEQANSERKHNVLYSQIGLIGFSLMITLSIMYSIGGF